MHTERSPRDEQSSPTAKARRRGNTREHISAAQSHRGEYSTPMAQKRQDNIPRRWQGRNPRERELTCGRRRSRNSECEQKRKCNPTETKEAAQSRRRSTRSRARGDTLQNRRCHAIRYGVPLTTDAGTQQRMQAGPLSGAHLFAAQSHRGEYSAPMAQ